jgi:hypothetical protein
LLLKNAIKNNYEEGLGAHFYELLRGHMGLLDVHITFMQMIGVENGDEASWIRKLLKEFSSEEKRDYGRKMTKWFRETESEEKKSKLKKLNRKYKYDKNRRLQS